MEAKQTNSNAIIRIEDLKRDFIVGSETVHALRGVTFDIQKGEFVAIMGTSGSGKSTMLNILGCLDKPTSGHYFIDGVDAALCSKDELSAIRNHKIGFVFQSYNLLPRTTSIEQVELPLLYNSKIGAKERRERAERALELVGMANRANHTPNQMSGGQQQRIAIARAIVNDPVILLADEATGNLDTRTSYEIMSLFQKLNENGVTIGFVTHEPDIALFTKRQIMLRDGKVMKDVLVETQSAQAALDALPKSSDY